MPPLVYVRHGETDWNAADRLQGQLDIPLNDRGRGQARQNGLAIAEKFPETAEFDFVSSPLVRARETMEIVRRSLGLSPTTYRLDDRLKELAFGEWEGITNSALAERDPQIVAARQADMLHFAPPGGESYHSLLERVSEWRANLTRPTCAVAHGGVGRVLRAIVLDIDPYDAIADYFPQDKAFFWREGTETHI